MTVEEQIDDAPATLDRHRGSVQRNWRIYGIVVGLLVLAIAAWVAVVWSRSEIVHASLHSANSAPPAVPPDTLTDRPELAWRSDEHTASGDPFQGGTVVTYSTHTVHGRDARTGDVTWSYTRSDRTICTVVQTQNRTVAFFRHNGNCDQLNAFTTDTGRRVWDRTLDTEGHPVNGTPTITARADGLFVSTEAVVYAIRLNEGFDFWEYAAPDDCRNTSVAIGTTGALIAQSCADGNHLLLRDRFAGNDDNNHPVKWRLGNTTVLPFAADSFVAALDPANGQLLRYDPASGRVIDRLPLTPTPATSGTAFQTTARDSEVVWWAGTTYALDGNARSQLWSASTAQPLTLTAGQPSLEAPTLGTAVLLVVTSRGVDVLDGRDGRVARSLAVPAVPSGSRAFPVGTGFVLAGASTIVYK